MSVLFTMARLLYDLVFAGMMLFFYGAALVPGVGLVVWAAAQYGWIGGAVAAPAAYLVSLTALVLLVGMARLMLPRVKAGKYALPMSRGVVIWMLHLSLQRLINNGLIKDSIFYLNGLRTLYLKLMGARIPLECNISGNVNLMDPSLLEVGRGSTIGSGVAIFGHFMVGKALVLRRNRIGEKVMLGAYTGVAPGLTAGDRVFIGAACNIGNDVEIGAGARVEGGSDVMPKTKIPAGERWGGRPARRLDGDKRS